MSKAYYYNTINDFLSTSTEAIQGKILINDELIIKAFQIRY